MYNVTNVIYKTYDWETYKYVLQYHTDNMWHTELLSVWYYGENGIERTTADLRKNDIAQPENFDGWVITEVQKERLDKENKGKNVQMGISKQRKRELFEPRDVELVEFVDNSGTELKTLYFPKMFFVLSDYMFSMLKSSTHGESGVSYFLMEIGESDRKWLLKKVEEWKKYIKTGDVPNGAFWSNLETHYSAHDGMIPKFDKFQSRRANDIDGYRVRTWLSNWIEGTDEVETKEDSEDANSKYFQRGKDMMSGDNHYECKRKRTNDEVVKSHEVSYYRHERKGFPERERYNESKRVKRSERAEEANKTTKGIKMKSTIGNVKNVVVDEFKELVNVSGAADIALGRMLYNNIKAMAGRTIVKIDLVDRLVAKVSKKMKYKNEMTELIGVLTALVVLKQFYDHKALENVRGYIVSRIYTIGIEATGADDILALMKQADSAQVIND